jgi:hypothetical protein
VHALSPEGAVPTVGEEEMITAIIALLAKRTARAFEDLGDEG